MAIRPHPTKGHGWWYIDVGHREARQRYPFEGSKADALELETQIRKRLRPGGPAPNPRIDEIVDAYKRHRAGEGVKPSTIQKELAALSGLLKWAADEKMIDVAPKIKNYPAKMTRAPLPKVPTLDEAQAIIAELPADRRGLFAAMLWCGLRSSEATHLKHKDVMAGHRSLAIHGKGSKYRMVP